MPIFKTVGIVFLNAYMLQKNMEFKLFYHDKNNRKKTTVIMMFLCSGICVLENYALNGESVFGLFSIAFI